MKVVTDMICSSAIMRCFIAINIPDAIRMRIGEEQKQLQRIGSGVRWVPPMSQHLTLKFLGDVSPAAVSRIAEVASSVASGTPKFQVRICRLGAFPSLHRPRVFWAGIHEQGNRLAELAARLEEKLSPLGFESEERAWNPHITLGRVKDAFALKALIDYIRIESSAFDAGLFAAEDMILFQSILRPEGAIYTQLKRFEFRGKPDINANT
jgi:RNA 2',3'-cyclic 3'-phosphodiesterase